MDDVIESTQEATQSTQAASQSQPQNSQADEHIWGFLQPCNPVLRRIDMWKAKPLYQFGRNAAVGVNAVVFPGLKISNIHCTIEWDGMEDPRSVVTVHDKSSNGTFINGRRIGKGQYGILRDGNEIAFGTPTPQENPMDDYRFLFRLTAGGPPATGFYKEYDIGLQLGKGTFASVYKAIHKESGQWYAVKIIDLAKVKNPVEADENGKPKSRSQSFAREIMILESLQHKNICQLKEAFFQTEYQSINLVLELVEGGDLLDHILSRGGLMEDEAQHIAYQMCDALAYIHSRGIAHRDLKPENVLLTRDVPPVVKVADFGLAKAVDSLTMLRTMCGTPSYLAPEVVSQTANQEGYHQIVDSWSVGVIVFSMVTNSSPFLEDENLDIMHRILQRQIDWKTLHGANVSQLAIDFVTKLLEINPDHRMTLDAARFHPWLAQYASKKGIQQTGYPVNCLAAEQRRTESATALANAPPAEQDNLPSQEPKLEPELSELIPIPGAFPSGAGRTGERLLRRRSHVITDAAENGEELPQPSQEMIANVTGESPSRAGSQYGNGNKRKAMSPVPEDESEQDSQRSNPLSDANGSSRARARGKGKATAAPSESPRAGATRTRGAAAQLKEEEEEEDFEEERFRRASRPKVARRV
ncbi:Pkinase-domain-containing protein [Heliocybe sulcata]|uniref:Pkinase-domain-containing protein n=1 Tax=Heliocybe sulcata TaxID=5364 RepID=A0A5C3NB97_9AGAM|nr:Pkinase-domain-containing protein [Heliocybe sulcata]